jgi:hypothetical protein
LLLSILKKLGLKRDSLEESPRGELCFYIANTDSAGDLF